MLINIIFKTALSEKETNLNIFLTKKLYTLNGVNFGKL